MAFTTGSFQPTYEELKPHEVQRELERITCFQPTYEELKLEKSVPSKIEKKRFSAYLRGIETTVLELLW